LHGKSKENKRQGDAHKTPPCSSFTEKIPEIRHKNKFYKNYTDNSLILAIISVTAKIIYLYKNLYTALELFFWKIYQHLFLVFHLQKQSGPATAIWQS